MSSTRKSCGAWTITALTREDEEDSIDMGKPFGKRLGGTRSPQTCLIGGRMQGLFHRLCSKPSAGWRGSDTMIGLLSRSPCRHHNPDTKHKPHPACTVTPSDTSDLPAVPDAFSAPFRPWEQIRLSVKILKVQLAKKRNRKLQIFKIRGFAKGEG